MELDLKALLPILLPKACAWAETQEQIIITTGIPLTKSQIGLAQFVGVASPEKVRIKIVPSLPIPEDPALSTAAAQVGLLDMDGITFNHGIYVRNGYENSRELIAHEC